MTSSCRDVEKKINNVKDIIKKIIEEKANIDESVEFDKKKENDGRRKIGSS
jgi:hypothetical protein